MRQEQSSMFKTEFFRQTRQSCLKDWQKRIEVMTYNQDAGDCKILERDIGPRSYI